MSEIQNNPVKLWDTTITSPKTLSNPSGNSLPISNTLSSALKLTSKLGLGSNFLNDLGNDIPTWLSTALGINTASNVAFGLLNPNGNSTGVGNAMQSIGGLASNIPGVGGLVGAGLNAVGGLVNAAFGSNIKNENVALFRAQNKEQANYTSNASTNTELLADFASMSHLGNVPKKDVGSDGWFSNKAKNLTRDINREREAANIAAITSLGNTALTVDTTNDLLKEYNYVAYGGPINMRYTGIMSPFGNLFKDGGIYIKPENRGKFTALKERTGKSATWFKEHGTPAQKKMATFALNARKWKHDDGGELIYDNGGFIYTHGGVFDNGVLEINTGDTHELNPYGGILVGIDEQGVPNLVEEGELIWNDYVFSNRLKVPKSVREKYKLRDNKDLKFAEAAKELQKESKERPNDPISKNGLNVALSDLANEQELIRMKKELKLNVFKDGGIKKSPLRYAPILGHAFGVFNDLFSKPDYLASDRIGNIELNPSLVGFTPIGNKLKFTPYDINSQISRVNANAGAARRNIMNTSGGNRAAAMAGLMGVDRNYYDAVGNTFLLGLEYNDKRRDAVESFNRATDLYNAEMGLKASIANAESRNAMTRARYERDRTAALLGQLARDAYNARRSNNLNILLEDIGNLGRERDSLGILDWLAEKGAIKVDSKGNFIINNSASKPESNSRSNGGKINRKKGDWKYA